MPHTQQIDKYWHRDATNIDVENNPAGTQAVEAVRKCSRSDTGTGFWYQFCWILIRINMKDWEFSMHNAVRKKIEGAAATPVSVFSQAGASYLVLYGTLCNRQVCLMQQLKSYEHN